jgi:hypothetical protein
MADKADEYVRSIKAVEQAEEDFEQESERRPTGLKTHVSQASPKTA